MGKRWPLSIDPQGQANKFIRAMEGASRQLAIARPTEKHLLRTLEAAIRSGGSVLLEDVGEALDASLESILSQARACAWGVGAYACACAWAACPRFRPRGAPRMAWGARVRARLARVRARLARPSVSGFLS